MEPENFNKTYKTIFQLKTYPVTDFPDRHFPISFRFNRIHNVISSENTIYHILASSITTGNHIYPVPTPSNFHLETESPISFSFQFSQISRSAMFSQYSPSAIIRIPDEMQFFSWHFFSISVPNRKSQLGIVNNNFWFTRQIVER